MTSTCDSRHRLSSLFRPSFVTDAGLRIIPASLALCGLFVSFNLSMAESLVAGNTEAPSVGLLNAQALALNPANDKLYAVDTTAGTVDIVDGKTHLTSTVKVGASPVALTINTATNRVYVANNRSGTVSVLDGSTDAVIGTVDVGRTPYVVAANPVTNRIYVSNTFNNLITVIDGTTDATRTVNAGSADKILIDTKRNKVYLLGYESSALTVLDGTNDTFVHKPAGKMHLWGFDLDSGTDELYVSRIENADVVALAENSDASIAIPTGKIPCAIAVNPRTNAIYVVNYQDESVTVIDGTRHIAVATVPVEAHPQAIAVDPNTNLIYVTNMHGNSVTVIDGATNRTLATLPAGTSPYAIAVDSKDAMVYVADLDRRSLTQIDVHALRERTLSPQKN